MLLTNSEVIRRNLKQRLPQANKQTKLMAFFHLLYSEKLHSRSYFMVEQDFSTEVSTDPPALSPRL